MSYGFDPVDQFSRAAPYVDRVLRVHGRRNSRSNFRSNLNWLSISRPLRRLGSMSRQLCSFVPKNGRLALKAAHWMINHVLQDEAAAGRISN